MLEFGTDSRRKHELTKPLANTDDPSFTHGTFLWCHNVWQEIFETGTLSGVTLPHLEIEQCGKDLRAVSRIDDVWLQGLLRSLHEQVMQYRRKRCFEHLSLMKVTKF